MQNQRRSSSPVLSPPVLIVLIPIAAFVFLFVAVPPLVSFASNIFRPLAFRNGWDFLNILLVLFAVLCGVFANRNDDEPDSATAGDAPATVEEEQSPVRIIAAGGTESGSDNPQRWFGYTEGYPGVRTTENTGVRRLRRSSSSYPDLRHDSLWDDNRDEHQRVRFFDDFEVHKHRQTTPFHSPPRNPPEEEAKVIPTADNTPPPGPPPPPPPPPSDHRKPRRSYQAAGRREKRAEKHGGSTEADAKVVPSPPPPPPRPPPSPARIRTEPKKLERRKSNVKKEIATALASLYNQRKRKRKQKITTIITSGGASSSSGDLDSAAQSPPAQQQYSGFPPPSPPPPPPPLPPSSVFNSLFKKGTSKTKRIHSVPPPPPPPPLRSKIRSNPPPPRSRLKPPLPAKPKSYDDNASSGGQSPLIPIPPPPPPPFKMAEWKFDVRGDFVRILSAQSSRCGSPELDDGDSSSAKGGPDVVNAMDGADGARAGLVFCPSPDVNLKADNFIARLYDGWRLEKIKSLRENRKM